MQNTRQQVRRVLLITLLLNAAVSAGKIVLGMLTGALAITADGVHSLVDGASNILGMAASRIAEQPPDDEHPYGHRRFETIAALGIGTFLLLTAREIIGSALDRLQGGGSVPAIDGLAFAVMLATLAVNVFVTRYEAREGRRLNSEILIADSAHTAADVWVTLSVLVSMTLVVLFGWTWVDTAAALVIVLLIVRAAWQVLRQTGSILVDTAPYSAKHLAALVSELPAVNTVLRARSRGPADAAHIDIDVAVAPEMTAEHTAAIAAAIREKLRSALTGVDEIVVRFLPNAPADADYTLAARACADSLGLATHEVQITHDSAGSVTLALHVEVPPGQTLDQAHQLVSQFEQKLHEKLPALVEIITHIEPALPAAPDADDALSQAAAQAVGTQAETLLQKHYPQVDWHDFRVCAHQRGLTMTLHAALPARISIESAHDIAESAETLLRAAFPKLDRVTIHTEPPEG